MPTILGHPLAKNFLLRALHVTVTWCPTGTLAKNVPFPVSMEGAVERLGALNTDRLGVTDSLGCQSEMPWTLGLTQ